MSNLDKSAYLGGIYPFLSKNGSDAKEGILNAQSIHDLGHINQEYSGARFASQEKENCLECAKKHNCKYYRLSVQLEKYGSILRKNWQRTEELSKIFIKKFGRHILKKQELYLPVLVALILMALVFASRITFSKNPDQANNLPINDHYKVKLISLNPEEKSPESCLPGQNERKENDFGDDENLRNKIVDIVKNTPMSAMTDQIAQKPRPVAAFIVGIAMKESKFGIYSPKLGGRDCYNYWGFKGGGKTVAGGYSCFSSPEEAVEKVGNRIEKLVARGVQNPAQMISWKCGSSCAGHGAENVSKWIADVSVNFYKIVNS